MSQSLKLRKKGEGERGGKRRERDIRQPVSVIVKLDLAGDACVIQEAHFVVQFCSV